ncbi:hypothetical protein Celly_2624 [Cellulophaga lytica DSM 7489]|uniref:O-antigen polymerase n=1 Tax=Cellulophaga lytica (strain ATCC 23178 / DSM 7489 / JCM 8516 / NBRC 14961 / NCIMB 1423 / VKM B-1433 / Cy l20) TaxID=867900 RepID=F0R9U6_CELLC|nr:O-antigen ligase family protein [Cellulophaga lytica]ADY30441.1 hypothetical protein Celly_2624 [Cellulophaga lytica DSM 7489]WQG78627.1 O-antigen ligase family protein [Cellulophaga lytica]
MKRELIDKIQTIGFIPLLFLIGLFTNIFNYGHLFAYGCIGLILFKKQFLKKAIDRNFLLLTFFSVTYGMFYALNPWKGFQFVIIYASAPPVLYLWGKYISTVFKESMFVFFTAVILTLIYSFPAMVSVVLNILEGGFGQLDRNLPMFWGGEPINATAMGAFFVFNMCIPALLFSAYKVIPKYLIIVLGAIFVISLLCVLRIGSRTQLAIFILSLIISLVVAIPKRSFKENSVTFTVFAILLGVVATQVSLDLDSDILATFASRMEDDGAADIASGGGRTKLWVKSIDYMFEKPLGWDLQEFGYSHNLWLDALRVGGFIPFVILILYSLRFINLIYNIFFSKKIDMSFQILCLTYTLGFFSLFMVEPGIDGTFTLFILFCLFVGLVRHHYITTNNGNVLNANNHQSIN